MVNPVLGNGHFADDVPLIGGMFFKAADPTLVADLRERGVLFRAEDYEHSYPHCWRCHTPLIYYALPSWFIRTTEIRERLLEENEKTSWYPPHIKHGRYGAWLENNVDWALSRKRYWGTPLPVWRNDADPSELVVVGSLAELGAHAGQDLSALDPHRPYVDDVTFPAPSGTGTMRRVPDVIDVWYDSGAMPFAQWGAPHHHEADFEAGLPGAVHLRGDRPDARVVLLADGGRHPGVRPVVVRDRGLPGPAARRAGPQDVEAPREHPRPVRAVLHPRRRRRAVADARVRLPVGGPARRPRGAAGDRPEGPADLLEHRVVPRHLRERLGLVALRRRPRPPSSATPWTAGPSASCGPASPRSPRRSTTSTPSRAGRAIVAFVDDLSNWYVRRSRRRFWDGDAAALATLHECLETVSRLMAPFTPFATDYLWTLLQGEGGAGLPEGSPDSVHLAPWPQVTAAPDAEAALRTQMDLVRRVVELGRSTRAASGVRTRQPLSRAVVSAPGFAELAAAAADHPGQERELLAEIAEELNVAAVETGGLGPRRDRGQAELPRARQALRQAHARRRRRREGLDRRPGRRGPDGDRGRRGGGPVRRRDPGVGDAARGLGGPLGGRALGRARHRADRRAARGRSAARRAAVRAGRPQAARLRGLRPHRPVVDRLPPRTPPPRSATGPTPWLPSASRCR